jgi:hypothetical protein
VQEEHDDEDKKKGEDKRGEDGVLDLGESSGSDARDGRERLNGSHLCSAPNRHNLKHSVVVRGWGESLFNFAAPEVCSSHVRPVDCVTHGKEKDATGRM